MEVKIITAQEYKEYLENSKNGNFWQSDFYFAAKSEQGQEVMYVGGYIDQKLCAVGGLLVYPSAFGKKIYRCPRGFLLDYHDTKLVKEFFIGVKKLLRKHQGLYLRFDPYVEFLERDIDGEEVVHGYNNQNIVDTLIQTGCKHRGFYRGYDVSGEPRWMFALDLKGKTKEQVRNELSQQTRWSLKRAEKNGIKVRTLTKEELPLFVKVMEHTEQRRGFESPSLDYYEKMYDYGKENIKFVVAELDFQEYKHKIEQELQQHEQELLQIQEKLEEQPNSKKFLKKKKVEEEAIEIANKKLQEVSSEEGTKVLAASMFSTYGKEVLYLFSGAYEEYMTYYAPYMIQWEMISYAIDHEYDVYNFYGISGNFDKENEDYGVYRFKRGFQGRVVELIGDFEYVVNPLYYNIYLVIKKILKK